MGAPVYSANDFQQALQALMPVGLAWPRDSDAVQSKTLAGLSLVYVDQTARSANLLIDAFPATATELLPEWESTLGLPLLAAGPAPTIEARRTLVVARLVGCDGMSVPTYTRYAARLGYVITVRKKAPFRCGQSRCGHRLGGAEQMFGWTVFTSSSTATVFGAYGPAVLQSELARLAPPNAVLDFKFT